MRWWGLRGRATVAFAVVTLVVAVIVAAAVWWSVSGYLLRQRERSTLAQVLANADQAQRGMHARGLSTHQVLSQLPREVGSTSLLRDEGEWFTTGLQIGPDDLPPELLDAVANGQPSRQRFIVDDRPMLAVGVPLAQLEDAYFEIFPLNDLDETYRLLSGVLLAAALACPLVALVVGWWVTRPAFRPLQRVSAAAAAIAGGDLDTRIDPRGDPDLAPIAESFNRTAAALQHRVRNDARFAADVSHELRSPLTTMVSALALAESHRTALPPDGREALGLLRGEVARFERLVDDLLEISRSDAGSSDLCVEHILLPDLVRHAVPLRLRGRVRVTPAAMDLTVCADKRRLERVVANLVDNAERHGQGLAAVTVDRSDGWAQLAVDDAGPGLNEDEVEHIFDRFARGRRTGRASSDGAGLGLALVARHVLLMHGAVAVDESPQGGARFVVTLPVADETCPD